MPIIRAAPFFFHLPAPFLALLLIPFFTASVDAATVNVSTAAQLRNAVNNGAANDVIVVAAGTYALTATLLPRTGMTIRGAGTSKTTIKNAGSWAPGTSGLPDNAVQSSTINTAAYLISIPSSTASNITIRDLTLSGSGQLHGAICGAWNPDGLKVFNCRIENFSWSGIRTFTMSAGEIHDNEFVDAGGTQQGIQGGGLYMTWTENTHIYNNHFSAPTHKYYGIKGREIRSSRIFNNTIQTFFSIEFPFENDWDVEIDHNWLGGAISLPKYDGGSLPASGVSFHIHHNCFTTSYSLEWARNGVEVDHNLFDFSTSNDGGNLISSWIQSPTGPTSMHDNLIKNPGRGIFWSDYVYNGFSFFNNHVITNTTATPRTEGLFSFASGTNLSTITIKDNIIECIGLARPLMRRSATYGAVIKNNTLTNVSDSSNYANPNTGAKRGLLAPLQFTCGVTGEYSVNQWVVSKGGGGSGSIAREYWTGISGTNLSAVNWSSAPSGTDTLSSLEGPINWADNYGSRVRGYITAPASGSYIFWLATDDEGELWLSSNDNPANKSRIAAVSGWTTSRQWNKYASQKSAARNLVAGQRYYVEILQKEGSGGDNLAVGWARPGQATSTPSEVVPGSALSPFTQVNLVRNPSFDDDRANVQSPQGWITWADPGKEGSDYTESSGGARTGTWHATHKNSSAYRVYTYQTITGLANGTYTLGVWTRSSGGQKSSTVGAKNNGVGDRSVSIPSGSTWRRISFEVEVANGTCEIGFWSDANPGNWVYFEDVEFILQSPAMPSGNG